MSFYFDDDDEYDLYYNDDNDNEKDKKNRNPTSSLSSSQQQQQQQQLGRKDKGGGGGGVSGGFVCLTCGGTESYQDDSSGALVCTECYTQSQTAVSLSQMQFDYEEAQGLATRTSIGQFRQVRTAAATTTTSGTTNATNSHNLSQRGKKLEEYDNSVRLPTVLECIRGMQRVLKETSSIVCELVFLTNNNNNNGGDDNNPSPKFVLEMVKSMWNAYLLSWQQGANELGDLYPEVRFCFRDLFLSAFNRTRLAKTLSYRAARQLKERIKIEMKEQEEEEQNEEEENEEEEEESSITETTTIDDDDNNNKNNNKKKNNKVEEEMVVDDDDVSSECSTDELAGGKVIPTKKKVAQRYQDMNPLAQLIHRHCKSKSKTRTIHIGRKEAALILEPGMLMVAGMILLATSSLGVTAGHVRKWISTGVLPLLDSWPLLRPEEQRPLLPIKDFFRLHTLPSIATIEKLAANLQVACGFRPRTIKLHKKSNGRKVLTKASLSFKPGRLLVPASVPLITARFVGELGLSQKVLNYALAIIGIKDLGGRSGRSDDDNDLATGAKDDENINDNLDIKQMWLPPHLRKARPDLILDKHRILAVIVVACKMIPGWQNIVFQGPTTARRRSENDSNDCKKEEVEEEEKEEALGQQHETTKKQKIVQNYSRFVPTRPGDFRFMKNGESVDGYLDFLEETIIDPNNTSMPDFVSTLLEKQEIERKQSLSTTNHLKQDAAADGTIVFCDTILAYKKKQQSPKEAKSKIKTTEPKKRKFAPKPRESHVYELTKKRPGAGITAGMALSPPLGPLIEYIAHKTMSNPIEILDFVAELDEEIVEKKKKGKLR